MKRGTYFVVLMGVFTLASSAGTPAAIQPATATTVAAPVAFAAAIERDGAKVHVQQQSAAPATIAPSTNDSATTTAATSTVAAPEFDFDNDGKDEIVVGSGSVVVVYSAQPRRDVITSPEPSPCQNSFGEAFVAGDFDGDNYRDLAIGDTCEQLPGAEFGPSGAVWVFYGTATGLDLTSPQHFNQNSSGIPGEMEDGDMFGSTLAAGSLDGDAFDELAVAVSGDVVSGVDWAGSVLVLRGSADGLTTVGAVELHQDTPGVPDQAEERDVFGSAVAIGDFTGDDFDDLVIAASQEGTLPGTFHDGLVMLFPGSASGVNIGHVTTLRGGTGEVPNLIVDLMRMRDMTGDGRADLVLGSPRAWGGEIVYVPGSAGGLSAAGLRLITQDTPGVPGDRDRSKNLGFGYSIATGDVTGDGIADLFVGVTGAPVGGIEEAGMVILIPGASDGPTGAGSVAYTQGAGTAAPPPSPLDGRRPSPVEPLLETAEAGDAFGHAVAILNLDGVGAAEMVAASPRETSAASADGVLVFLRAKPMVSRRGQQTPDGYTLSGFGRAYPADFGLTDRFGWALLCR